MQADKQPLLTVIMPAYNTEKYVEAAIESILNQSFQDFILIISDDGSSDNTRDLIDGYRRRKKILIDHNESNIGKTATVNRVFKRIESKYITIHDSDDISLPDRFESQIKLLEGGLNIGLVGCSFHEVNRKNEIMNLKIQPTNDDDIRRKMDLSPPFHGPTMIFEKKLLHPHEEVYRPFFESYKEDCDLALRLLERTQGFNIDKPLYRYRILPNSLSKKLSPKKRVTYSLAVQLAKQRRESGTDWIEKLNFDALNNYLEIQTKKYRDDKSLVHIETASFHVYYNLYPSAIKQCIYAIKIKPFKMSNYRSLLYCIRRAMTSFL